MSQTRHDDFTALNNDGCGKKTGVYMPSLCAITKKCRHRVGGRTQENESLVEIFFSLFIF
jgi:hypothetical protein